MTLDEFQHLVTAIERDGLAAIDQAMSAEALESTRHQLLGRKSGRLTDAMKSLPTLPAEERRDAGAAINRVKQALELALGARRELLVAEAPAQPGPDLSMPARHGWRGAKHPVTLVIEEIAAIFRELGFTIATGPEAEHEWYNFGALNFPSDHPAMELHDTIYLGPGTLLRTHTSPVQVRTLQLHRAPVRILAPGNVYRRDFFDASHAPMFAQIEGMAVDEGISFVDLKATLTYFANRFFGETATRFRPSYFPFTEPSAEMDVRCTICDGSGCPSCKGTGWMEILGSGMMHPAVLEAAGMDSERYTGWAFGMGPGRIANLRYGIPDIRLLYDSDIAFLEQFSS
ncbi:MAG TPA: phenylalanine--tRNA ligase subunit alpha [Gemmatimonadaceae bacterium]|jgi:phenylalanyl-tRNA synthetase alpha chain|nr:phenylalanine--tRNA ligase subunit alpha [Gemmatimonadaceae bacterium]